jgi:hypothetical protein
MRRLLLVVLIAFTGLSLPGAPLAPEVPFDFNALVQAAGEVRLNTDPKPVRIDADGQLSRASLMLLPMALGYGALDPAGLEGPAVDRPAANLLTVDEIRDGAGLLELLGLAAPDVGPEDFSHRIGAFLPDSKFASEWKSRIALLTPGERAESIAAALTRS